jgi:hypothetical protein
MLKKSLIALVLVALCSAPSLAHVTWGYGVTTTITWEWDSKPGPTIDVCMIIVMWAKLYVDGCLTLHQVDDSGDYLALFRGCKTVELCVNFKGIKVKVQYIPIIEVTKNTGNKGNKGENYRISIDEPGNPSYSGWKQSPTDEFHVTTLHTTTIGNKILEICLEARDVDPQYLEYSMGSKVKIGEITTLLTPTLAPPGVGQTEWSEYFGPVIP